jgi:CRP-like cAMP-binding protein
MGKKSSSDKRELLRMVPLFREVSKKGLDEIARIADEVTRAAGDLLARQGTHGLEFVFILEGQAKVDRDGIEINRLSDGDFFGEISLIDGNPRSATVTAETDVRLLVVHSRFFNQLLEQVPGLQKEIMIAVCRYLRTAMPQRPKGD